jgi:hypothetical protein
MTAHVDARIRDRLGPAASATPGLLAFYPGRRGTERDAARVLATIWESEAAMDAADAQGGLSQVAAELVPGTEEVLPLVVTEVGEDPGEPPAILRVFRGEVRDGHWESYIEAARNGTRGDIAAGTGPSALFLGEAGRDRFVTVSAWASWRDLEVATGGNIHQPIATRHVDHLIAGSVTHYEILPGAITGPSRVPTAAG